MTGCASVDVIIRFHVFVFQTDQFDLLRELDGIGIHVYLSILVVEQEPDLSTLRAFALLPAVEDQTGIVLGPQLLCPLTTDHEQDGIRNIGLAASVGPADNCQSLGKFDEDGLLAKGLEVLHNHFFQEHSGHTYFMILNFELHL